MRGGSKFGVFFHANNRMAVVGAGCFMLGASALYSDMFGTWSQRRREERRQERKENRDEMIEKTKESFQGKKVKIADFVKNVGKKGESS
mmetsp:Transcript_9740/g.18581  ORF Transcript_9740/g.18581 Transcript_9740/m.18581 type:complete len:89 (+) Transcript_9740:91-357(+)